MHASIDRPGHLELCDPLAIRIEGWLHAGSRHIGLAAVDVHGGGQKIGETALFFPRADVSLEEGIPTSTPTGFSVLGHLDHPGGDGRVELEFTARFTNGTRSAPFATRTINLIAADYRERPYGKLLAHDARHLCHRGDIYGSGPPEDRGSPECLALLRRHLGAPPCRVIDVGCGLGWYGKHLLRDGYDWVGVETSAPNCAELARRGLPHELGDGVNLTFRDGVFDAAVAIEVLEHVEEPRAFLSEIRRVARRLIVSVPNIELIPYLHPFLAVPWHLLEADHRNFFTRWSLKELLEEFFAHVEVVGYGEAPLRTVEGTRLDFHLLAVAVA